MTLNDTIALLVAAAVFYVACEVYGELRHRHRQEQERLRYLHRCRLADERERHGPDRITIQLTNHLEAVNGDERWRWTVWNAEPDVEDVRGLLVPYCLGTAATKDSAVLDAIARSRDRGLPLEGLRVVNKAYPLR